MHKMVLFLRLFEGKRGWGGDSPDAWLKQLPASPLHSVVFELFEASQCLFRAFFKNRIILHSTIPSPGGSAGPPQWAQGRQQQRGGSGRWATEGGRRQVPFSLCVSSPKCTELIFGLKCPRLCPMDVSFSS